MSGRTFIKFADARSHKDVFIPCRRGATNLGTRASLPMIAQAITITNLAGCGREARRTDVRRRTQKPHRKGGKAIASVAVEFELRRKM